LIKAATAFLFALLLGLMVPFVWLVLANYLCPSMPALAKQLFTGTLWPQATFAVSAILVGTAIGFYVSSFSHDTLRAIVGTAGLFIAFGFVLPFVAKIAHVWLPPSSYLVETFFRIFPDVESSSVRAHVAMIGGGFVLLWFFAASLLGSFRHFKALNHNPGHVWKSSAIE